MKRHLPFAALLVFVFATLCFAQEPTPSPSPKPKAPRVTKAQLQQQLSEMEKTLWTAWKYKDAAPFETNLSADTVMVGEMGVSGKSSVTSEIKNCDVKSFSLSDWKMTKLNASAALLTYKATEEGSCGGMALPSSVWASSIWVKRKDVWVAAFHQETPARK